jgi:uncharacterized protein
MSQENVEVVRRGYEAFNRGDLQGMVADFAPTFEYVPTGVVPGFDRDVYRGPDGMKEFMGWMRDEFDDPRAEIDELIEAGDQVLVGVIAHGRGKQSGVEGSWHFWHLWTVRDRKLVRGQGFVSREEALKAAGLRE